MKFSVDEYNLKIMYNNQDFPSQDMEVEDYKGEVLLDQEEEQPGDSLEPLVYGEADLFSDSLLLYS